MKPTSAIVHLAESPPPLRAPRATAAAGSTAPLAPWQSLPSGINPPRSAAIGNGAELRRLLSDGVRPGRAVPPVTAAAGTTGATLPRQPVTLLRT